MRLLSKAEIRRAQAFRSEMAYRDFVAAHILVRRVAATVGNLDVEEIVVVQTCDVCGGPHGRPVVEGHSGLHISMSHGAGWVTGIAGMVRNAVDIEQWESFIDPAMINDRIYCAEELDVLEELAYVDGPGRAETRAIAAAQMWARKECMIKLGALTLDGMSSFNSLVASEEGSSAAFPRFFDWISSVDSLVGAAAVMDAAQPEFDCGPCEFSFVARSRDWRPVMAAGDPYQLHKS